MNDGAVLVHDQVEATTTWFETAWQVLLLFLGFAMLISVVVVSTIIIMEMRATRRPIRRRRREYPNPVMWKSEERREYK